MTHTTSPALRTTLAYYQAWTSHDLEKAMSYIADDMVLRRVGGPHRRRRGVPRFHRPVHADRHRLQTDRRLRRPGNRASHVRHRDRAGKSAPGAEYVTVKDGKITYSRFIFDRAPFDAARKTAGCARPGHREPATTARDGSSALLSPSIAANAPASHGHGQTHTAPRDPYPWPPGAARRCHPGPSGRGGRDELFRSHGE